MTENCPKRKLNQAHKLNLFHACLKITKSYTWNSFNCVTDNSYLQDWQAEDKAKLS